MLTKLLLFTGSRLPASAPIVGLPSYPWSKGKARGPWNGTASHGHGCKKGAPCECRFTQPKRMREDKKRKNLPKLSPVPTKERERRRGNRGFDDLQILTSPDTDDAQMSIPTGRSPQAIIHVSTAVRIRTCEKSSSRITRPHLSRKETAKVSPHTNSARVRIQFVTKSNTDMITQT